MKPSSAAPTLALLVFAWAVLPAQGVQEHFTIDFEGFAEGTPISSQYASLGVSFGILGDPMTFPVIVTEGQPLTAFNSAAGADSPMASGTNGLTHLDATASAEIEIVFNPPVVFVRLYAIDIDASESVGITAFDGGAVVDSETHSAGEGSGLTGNGVATEYTLQASRITSLRIGTTTAYALDALSFTRPCSNAAACDRSIEVAQESSAGAGDFDANVLGHILSFPAHTSTATEVYSYAVPTDSSWNGLLISPTADRSHLFVGETLDGTTLFVVHDRASPPDPDGGRAEMRCQVLGDGDGAFYSVQDDPNPVGSPPDTWIGNPGDSLFASRCQWSPTRTDGFALSDLDAGWSLIVEFTEVDGSGATPPILGLNDWHAYSADGGSVALSLSPDRRVRLRPSTIAFPGTGEDFVLETGVNGPPSPGAGFGPSVANAGDLLVARLSSPAGIFQGAPFVLAAHLFPTGAPQVAVVPGLWLDVGNLIVLVDGVATTPLGPAQVVGPVGNVFAFIVPPALASQGQSLLLQGAVFAPVALNGAFAFSDAHVITIP